MPDSVPARRKRSPVALSQLKAKEPRMQYGALCWRHSNDGVKVLLVTSRETKRWVIPKGWPMKKRAPSDAAAREAWEEAGVRGDIAESSIGLYRYPKYLTRSKWISCVVRVYPLQVTERVQKYPERDERRTKWFTLKKAAKRVDEPELSKLLLGFVPPKEK